MEFFTNAQKTKDEEVDISTPAFSITKVQTTVGLLITAVLGAVPAALRSNETIIVAAIAAGTVILLGVFALVAVDIMTRQRAHEASLRYGDGKATEKSFQALPTEELVLQQGHSTDEYELKLAMVEGDSVRLVAARNGDLISATFKEAPAS
jgi:hypothetical protein